MPQNETNQKTGFAIIFLQSFHPENFLADAPTFLHDILDQLGWWKTTNQPVIILKEKQPGWWNMID